MKHKYTLLAGVLATAWAAQAHAAVTASQAAALGTTLTKFGAIQAGSADGAIPPYTGGIKAISGLPTNGGTNATGWPDPFASDKPLFTITSANMAQYADQLTPGVQALLTRFPDYSVTVYPTRRTASYPDFVLANTLKNATTAQEVGDGDGVTGAYGGVPFPIPQDGNQAMWNGTLRYFPPYCTANEYGVLVDATGNFTDLASPLYEWYATPYYDPSATSLPTTTWQYFKVLGVQPPANNGKQYLFLYTTDYTKSDEIVWYYTPGTRRVRLAPEDKYDTPISDYGGAFDFDEINMWSGQLNKFDWQLVGEKEMIIPYNDYKLPYQPINTIFGAHNVNPALVRWERHRVWMVTGTLKSGERHIYSKWNFYLDEDSWIFSMAESYDHSGAIYRVEIAYPSQNYGDGDATFMLPVYSVNDLSKNQYTLSYISPLGSQGATPFRCYMTLPNMGKYTPQAMAASGIH